jgi:transcriptional regulator with XRE-family HTH domain
MSTNETDEPADFTLLPAAFGVTLRMEAARKGLNQMRLIEATGLSKGTIGNYWHGETTPRLKEMELLGRALGLSPTVLYQRIMDEHTRMLAENQ